MGRPVVSRRRASLVFAAAGLAGAPGLTTAPPESAAQEPVVLRLEADEGEAATYRHELRIRAEAPAEFGGSRRLDGSVRIRERVEDVRGDTLQLRATVEEVAFTADSATRRQLEAMASEGETYALRVTRRGEVVSHAGGGGSQGGEGSEGGGLVGQVQGTLRQTAFPTLPPEPVAPGATWTDTTRVSAGLLQGLGGETVAVSRAMLRDVRREGGRRLAEIRVTTSYALRSAEGRPSPLDLSGGGRTVATFDVDAGRYVETRTAQRYTLELRFAAGAPPVRARFTVENTARLVEGGRDE